MIRKYSSAEPVQGLLDIVKRDLGLPADTKFEESVSDKRPRYVRIKFAKVRSPQTDFNQEITCLSHTTRCSGVR